MKGPSLILMRAVTKDFTDTRVDPMQLSFFPDEEHIPKLSAPGEDYPWRFHERMQFYLAQSYSAIVASVLAEEDVQREKAAEERERNKTRPKLELVS